jgi:hypothetical protein
LLAGGPMKAPEVFRDAEAHGYSKRQMQRACKRLGIKPEKVGMSGGWKWALPGAVATAPKMLKIPLSRVWHLRHLQAAPSAAKITPRTRRCPKMPGTKKRHLRHLRRETGGSRGRTARVSRPGPRPRRRWPKCASCTPERPSRRRPSLRRAHLQESAGTGPCVGTRGGQAIVAARGA